MAGLKIISEDYEVLRARVAPLDNPGLRHHYKQQGLSAKRYRWDLLWKSKIKIGDGIGIKGDLNLYAYMDDDHIDSALKRIVCTDENF